MSEAVVETQALTKKYGEFVALDQLSISLQRGQILGFIGPNGAGKTTAIKILVGLARPTAGQARIAGVDCVREARKIKHLVGYMPDRFGSYDNMRVREYLDFFGAAFKIPWQRRRQRIDQVLETTGSTYMADRFVETLSHGMQQRIGIARTLLHDPEVLILDEPANGLDPQARIEMRELLLHLAAMGKTLIVTSHILPELSRICDRVAILTHGRLRASGTMDEIMTQVRQKRLIEVQLPNHAQFQQASQTLAQALGDHAAVVPSEAEAILRFETDRPDDDLGRVLALLVSSGIRVSQFRAVVSDLEDAFLNVTRSEADAA
ncbi:MAG: ABC transporter ATP-binding protein [Planctomycetaceae bacterium]|nr:MAG: ABC transporter ATP-binding protein [Planctomycetaceae bacterium]